RAPEDHPVLYPIHPLASKQRKEKWMQMSFETFNTPALNFVEDGVLAMYGTGRTTGISVCCGDGITSCSPIFEGYSISHAKKKMNCGGLDMTESLRNYLSESNAEYRNNDLNYFDVERCKEKIC